MKKFEIGKTYTCRSVCDHNTVFEYTVITRTPKTMTLRDRHGIESRRGIKPSYCGTAESCKPEGTYSMCPVITAN